MQSSEQQKFQGRSKPVFEVREEEEKNGEPAPEKSFEKVCFSIRQGQRIVSIEILLLGNMLS